MGFESTIPAFERATVIGLSSFRCSKMFDPFDYEDKIAILTLLHDLNQKDE
jgi:hypothetical protein